MYGKKAGTRKSRQGCRVEEDVLPMAGCIPECGGIGGPRGAGKHVVWQHWEVITTSYVSKQMCAKELGKVAPILKTSLVWGKLGHIRNCNAAVHVRCSIDISNAWISGKSQTQDSYTSLSKLVDTIAKVSFQPQGEAFAVWYQQYLEIARKGKQLRFLVVAQNKLVLRAWSYYRNAESSRPIFFNFFKFFWISAGKLLQRRASVQFFFFLFSLDDRLKWNHTSCAGLFSIVKIHHLKFNATARKLLATFRPRAKLSIVVIVSNRDFFCGLMTCCWNFVTVTKKPPIRNRLTSQLAKPGSSNFWNFLNENTSVVWGLASRGPWDGGGGGGVLLPFGNFQYLYSISQGLIYTKVF